MYRREQTIAVLAVFVVSIHVASGSVGDRSQFHVNCMNGCIHSNCTSGRTYNIMHVSSMACVIRTKTLRHHITYKFTDAIHFQDHIIPDFFNGLFLWSCKDECGYNCMWRTTNAFLSRDWSVPQFYGKWPFKRFYGIQEPASVLFSYLNFLVHWRMIKKYRRECRSDSPMYYVWHVFCAVSFVDWECSHRIESA